jgi:hypothetical protein
MQTDLVDIDMKRFLQSKGKRRNAMIEGDCPDGQEGFHKYRKHIGVVSWNGWVLMTGESVFCMKLCLLKPVGVKFSNLQAQGIAIHQVPGIALELALDVGDESGRAVKPNPFATAKGHPEQTIEANKMIHVGMGQENILDS